MPTTERSRGFRAKRLAPILMLLTLAGAAGCERSIPPEEFGTPVYEESKLPGAGEPPPVLNRGTAPDSASDAPGES